jgi:hypothetical protein
MPCTHSKGALQATIDVDLFVETGDRTIVELDSIHAQIQQYFEALGQKGFRVLGVADRNLAIFSIYVLSLVDDRRIKMSKCECNHDAIQVT